MAPRCSVCLNAWFALVLVLFLQPMDIMGRGPWHVWVDCQPSWDPSVNTCRQWVALWLLPRSIRASSRSRLSVSDVFHRSYVYQLEWCALGKAC